MRIVLHAEEDDEPLGEDLRVENDTIYIGNLAQAVTENQLASVFSKYGQITHAQVDFQAFLVVCIPVRPALLSLVNHDDIIIMQEDPTAQPCTELAIPFFFTVAHIDTILSTGCGCDYRLRIFATLCIALVPWFPVVLLVVLWKKLHCLRCVSA